MDFSTDTLRGMLGADGLASPNRWRIILPSLSGKTKVSGGSPGSYTATDLNMLCTSARIPGKTVRTIDRWFSMVRVLVSFLLLLMTAGSMKMPTNMLVAN